MGAPRKVRNYKLCGVPGFAERPTSEPRVAFDAVFPVTMPYDIPRDVLEASLPMSDMIAELALKAMYGLDAKVMDAARAAWANGQDYMVATSTVMTEARPPEFKMALSRMGQAVPRGTAALPGFAILRPPPEAE